MKKIFAILLILSANASAQSFDGVLLDGPFNNAVAKFQAKGYKLQSYIGTGAIMKGTISNESVELHVLKTPKTNIVWKVAVSFPTRTSWSDLNADYEKYFTIIRNKYGHPETTYSFFMSPYEAGDGYEMTAVRTDHCRYISFWDVTDMSIFIEITKWAQVSVHYESMKNVELKKKEEEQINNTKF